MASSPEAAALTETHRLTQARLGAQTVGLMRNVWPLLDPQNVDGTFRRWLRAAQTVIGANRSVSTQLAAAYYRTFRALELGVDVPDAVPVFAETVGIEQLTRSLLVTGPIAVKNATGRGLTLGDAANIGEANSARAAMRHVLDGGRDTIQQTMRADTRSVGWARVTSGKACAFCAVLASRGPVYSKHAVHFKSHDGCQCASQPIFRHGDSWPAGSQKYRDLYNDVAKGTDDPLNAFRRALT